MTTWFDVQITIGCAIAIIAMYAWAELWDRWLP